MQSFNKRLNDSDDDDDDDFLLKFYLEIVIFKRYLI